MMSASARARRRGAITEQRFLKELREHGFQYTDPSFGEMYAFTHPSAPGRRFRMAAWGDSYARALDRFLLELRAS